MASTQRVAAAVLPTRYGDFQLIAYSSPNGKEHVALTVGVIDDDVTIARAIIDLGHNLGLVVVTEGVEMREIWDRLAAMRCDVAQDYYLSRPLPAADLTH